MSDYQIDPYKLNDVLQQILDKLASVEEKASSASPEFQVLMNNYLTKANEAERNQARFEEALERLELAEQEGKKFKADNEELKERIRLYERDFENLRLDNAREVNVLREELNKMAQTKQELEDVLSERYGRELKQFKADSEKQIAQLQGEVGEVLQVKRKLEEKLLMKTQEADVVERELNELKVKLADEQASIRNEIIEATKRSHVIEQRFQAERDNLAKRLRELEAANEELNSSLTLKQRELEYKDALLSQAMKKPSPEVSPLSVNKTASLVANSAPSNNAPQPPQTPYNGNNSDLTEKLGKNPVGGIWSKLN